MYQLIIVGGGPGGVAAGIYAARKKIKTLLIAEEFGGQSLVSADIRNWIGTKSISGFDLAQNLEAHLKDQQDIEIIGDKKVSKIEKFENGFRISTESGKSYETKFILITSGSRRRKLGIPGEANHEGKGVAYCSICDAPLFSGKDVAVVGAGNAGLEAVVDLLPYAKKIYLLNRTDKVRGDAITFEKVKKSGKVEVVMFAETQEVLGEKNVTGLKYKDIQSGEIKELKVEGVFVEIGIKPNSEIVDGLVELDERRQIKVDHRTQQTSVPGIWAAGDVTDVLYNQNNISAGDAIKAVLNIYAEINKTQ
ncbi:MAG: FAD-dependent oxidoreductase [bacterium]|nr:FAD-dependent oxidoreductase [bacterium]